MNSKVTHLIDAKAMNGSSFELLDNKEGAVKDEKLDTAVKTFNSLMTRIKEVLK